MKKIISFIILSLLISKIFFAQKSPLDTSAQNNIVFVEDNPEIAIFDSLVNNKFFKENLINSTEKPIINNFQTNNELLITDSVYEERIAKLNRNSPFEFVYNEDVKHYIERYTKKPNCLSRRALGLSKLYFPLFEELLDKYNLPLELKYLAIIESALNPKAVSRSKAVGLWQFMPRTGEIYNLQYSSVIDDRSDPYKSTVAACKHLSYLYQIYNDWFLVLAAYNSGSGTVNRAIKRSHGGTNYWEIRNHLPRETRNYVPGFIAINYAMSYASEHNIIPKSTSFAFHEIDTVSVKQKITFEQISQLLNIPIVELEFLNPAYKKGIIPASENKTYSLTIQKKYLADFINNEATLYNYKTEQQLKEEEALTQTTSWEQGSDKEIHVVRKGESLGIISRRYKCSIDDLKYWNNLNKNMIHPGQELLIYVPEGI